MGGGSGSAGNGIGTILPMTNKKIGKDKMIKLGTSEEQNQVIRNSNGAAATNLPPPKRSNLVLPTGPSTSNSGELALFSANVETAQVKQCRHYLARLLKVHSLKRNS